MIKLEIQKSAVSFVFERDEEEIREERERKRRKSEPMNTNEKRNQNQFFFRYNFLPSIYSLVWFLFWGFTILMLI